MAFWMVLATHSKPDADDCKYYGLVNKMLSCKPLVTVSPWSYAAYMYQVNVKVFTRRTGFLYETAVDTKVSVLVLMWVVGGVMYSIMETPAATWLLKHTPSIVQGPPQSKKDGSSESESVPLVQHDGRDELRAPYGTVTEEALPDNAQVLQPTPRGDLPIRDGSVISIQEAL
eukprot:CAMPEP_0118957864 /NCGR_PEP_ID=MMETSP1169-20130426/62328_1 /TAXON_ID=36882 /ORGANISM="Pyramimonas obovata, Strain CCMP722" /LENGTH=171 /DNA_ID=CAMNT_0006905967 /DNA_START=1268 /DNA_END=1783 /DNA_ORIENTATION=+